MKKSILLICLCLIFSKACFAVEPKENGKTTEKSEIIEKPQIETQTEEKSIVKKNLKVKKEPIVIPARVPFYVSFDETLSYKDRAQPFEMSMPNSVLKERGWVLGVVKLHNKRLYQPKQMKDFQDIKLIGNLGRTKKARIFNRGASYDVNITGVKTEKGNFYPAKVKLVKIIDNDFARIQQNSNTVRAKGSFWEKVYKSPSKWTPFDYLLAPVYGAIVGLPNVIKSGKPTKLYKGLPMLVVLEENVIINESDL